MKNITKILIVLGVIIFAVIASLFLGKGTETVKIGLSLPLSGKVAFLGESAQKAAELALRDAGNTKYQYQLVFEDDQFDPKRTVLAATKLMTIDKALAVISFGSGTANAINSLAESNKVVQFALASDPTAAKGEYNFIHWTSPTTEGELMAKEIVRRGHKTISIIDTNHAGTKAVTDAIRKSLQGTNVKIVSYDLTNMGDKDFRTIVSKVTNLKPDLIVLEMFSPEIELFARQLKEQGSTIPVTSVEAIEWSDELSLFEGNWFVSDSVVPEFATKYKRAYGVDPKPGASYVYDLVSFLIATQDAQSDLIKPADLPALIHSQGVWDSETFGKIKIDAEGFFITPASVKKVQNGAVVVE